jgi:DNA (cytosine-5)-methyltransferase 1
MSIDRSFPVNASASNGHIPFSALELFAGAGGLALGIQNAGFRHVDLVEQDRFACETLRDNAERGLLKGVEARLLVPRTITESTNYRSFTGPHPIDLLAGGPPCQPFSIGGSHEGRTDSRNHFPHFVRALGQLAPRAFLIENVRGLKRPAFTRYFDYLKLQLAYPHEARRPRESWRSHRLRLGRLPAPQAYGGLSYTVSEATLNAADYGVAQIRYRVFLVGIRRDVKASWEPPAITHTRARLRENLEQGAYWARHLARNNVGGHSLVEAVQPTLESCSCRRPKPWRTVRDAFAEPTVLPDPEIVEHSEYFNHTYIPGAKTYVGHTGSHLDWPAKTLKAGVHGVPGGENTLRKEDGSVRYFTVREAARLQSFPDAWRFHGPWRSVTSQLGSAVPVLLAEVVATQIRKMLRRDEQLTIQSPSSDDALGSGFWAHACESPPL